MVFETLADNGLDAGSRNEDKIEQPRNLGGGKTFEIPTQDVDAVERLHEISPRN